MGLIEDDAKRLMRKVLATLVAGLVWLFINTTIGIYSGWMFFDNTPSMGNYIFYGWMLVSFIALILFYYRIWSEDLRN